jgi:hypothetical protein
MRWSVLALILILILSAPCLADCTLSPGQRVTYLRKAAGLLHHTHKPAATTGQFKVRAHQYSSQYTGTYVLVKKIHIHEQGTWALKEDEWNTGGFKDFELSIDNANIGKYYQVHVKWVDGKTYQWDYQMKEGGTVVDVEKPF